MTAFFAQKHTHRFYTIILTILTLWMSLPGIASIQVLDRDESRFAQATIQMVESGDYLNIKLQDKARNKKPAGIYWLQAATVKAFTNPEDRKIWAHRIISVLGALIAVLATYWGTLAVLGRRGAFLSGAILATTLVFVAEAHIAKTDAMLCGLSALTLAALLRLQKQDDRVTAIIFWGALAGSILIKGPITPLIVTLTLITYTVWTRSAGWLKSLLSIPGIILALIMVLPWAIAIGVATDGAFYTDSLLGDMGSKMVSAQEKHGGPPGTFLATIFLGFWPGILLLLPGLAFASRLASKKSGESALKNSVRLLICWIIPFWLVLEIAPTKLLHYPLPLYPALSILCAGAFFAMLDRDSFKVTRRISALLFLIAAVILIIVIFGGNAMFAETQTLIFYAFPILVAFALAAAIWMWVGEVRFALSAAIFLACVMTPITYHHILPSLKDLRVSERISATLDQNNLRTARIISPNFTEPSLVYHLGTDILLGDAAQTSLNSGLKAGDILLVDQKRHDERYDILTLNSNIQDNGNCLVEKDRVLGTNISRMDPVEIRIYQVESCG